MLNNGERNIGTACTQAAYLELPKKIHVANFKIRSRAEKLREHMITGYFRARAKLICERGQGTTEYAILVGVLVVIAILAIVLFRPRLEELWNSIAEGINGL